MDNCSLPGRSKNLLKVVIGLVHLRIHMTVIMKNKKLKLGIVVMILFQWHLASAQTVDNTNQIDQPKVYPYEQTFTITAYYSPIEGQKRRHSLWVPSI